MQERRVKGRQLVALEAADDVRRRRSRVQCLEFGSDFVQTGQCAAVVVFVMALDEPRRDSVQGPGTAEQRGKLVSHRLLRGGLDWRGAGGVEPGATTRVVGQPFQAMQPEGSGRMP